LILRLHYKKNGLIKFNAHLDMVRLFERALRRSSVPLKFSQGFNPHPKMSFAAPLSVGVSSDYELIDIEVTAEADIAYLTDERNRIFPEGIDIVKGKHIEDSRSLMSMLSSGVFLVQFATSSGISYEALDEVISGFMGMDNIEYVKVSRKGKSDKETTVNIRPHVNSLSIVDANEDGVILKMTVSQGSQFNLKPEVVLERLSHVGGFEVNGDSVRLHRLMMYGDDGGKVTQLYEMH
jgi:radical SAM-linked protein